MTSTHREVELKFRAPADFDIPDLAAVPGISVIEAQPSYEMSNTYYDTPDLRLYRWRVTLRRREGGPDEGWHLKLPVESAGEGVRDEIRAPLSAQVPPALADVVAAFARGEALVPVAALRTRRTPVVLRDTGGTAVVEIVDDTVTVLDGGRPAHTFREIEAEALPGPDGSLDEDALQRVGEVLRAAGATPGTLGKAGAALGPRAAVPPEIAPREWPDASAPAGDAVHAYLALHARRLILADVRLRRGLPDAVHQMRVSARRLRSGLKAFGPLVDTSWAAPLRDELRWMASGLGDARDAEVLRDRLDGLAATLDGDDAILARAAIDTALEARIAEAAGAARRIVDSPRYLALLDAIVDGVRRPPLSERADDPAREQLPPLVRKAFRRLARRVADLELETPSAHWHEARISAKQARYASDAVAPVLGHGFARLAEHLEQVTEILGHHQDSHVAQEALRDLSATADPRTAFALGRLLAAEEEAERADRAALLDLWPSVARAAHRAGVS